MKKIKKVIELVFKGLPKTSKRLEYQGVYATFENSVIGPDETCKI